jgi:hypothetical protein
MERIGSLTFINGFEKWETIGLCLEKTFHGNCNPSEVIPTGNLNYYKNNMNP